jgi:hypothetical protein
MYLIQVSGIQQTASEYVLAVCFFFCTLIVWYLLNLGGMMYSPNSYPWPYANGAGSLNGNENGNENGNKNGNENGNNNFDFKHLIKLGFTFLNITLVLLYGWWFWRTVPRNFVNHSVFY